jgi:hypothetical protein
MLKISRCLALFCWVALVAGCAATAEVDTEEGACYLEAAQGDVYVKAFDLDRNGNMGPLIWQGRIQQGQTARIRTAHAYFRYYYNLQPDVDQPLSGGLDKACDDLDVVSIP